MQWTFDDPKVVEGFNEHIRTHLPFYEMMHDMVAYLIKNYLPSEGSVVDLGASTGNLIHKILPTLIQREASVVAVDNSYEMIKDIDTRFNEEIKSGIVHTKFHCLFDSHDIYVACLVLSFVPVNERQEMINKMIENATTAVIIVDKIIDHDGYLASVLRRLTIHMKLKAGVGKVQALEKEMSLAGVQIPLDPAMLGEDAKLFFRVGEFAGWIIEKG
jgi:tRNA (cmo5U34)-methyltransferase